MERTKNLGLNTLNFKVGELESKLARLKAGVDEYDDSSGFTKSILQVRRDKDHLRVKNELDRIYTHFNNGIENMKEDRPVRDFLMVYVQYSMIYVEQNVAKFARCLRTAITGEFKLDTCLSLLSSISGIEQFSEKMIENCINLLCPLLFIRKEKEGLPTLPPVQEQPLTRANSVRSNVSHLSQLDDDNDDLKLLDPRKKKGISKMFSVCK